MGAGHPECPERLDAITERLQAEGLRDLLAYEEAPAIEERQLLLAHTPAYVAHVKAQAARLSLADGRAPPWIELDPDTRMNAHTWAAASRAAGAAVAAVDAVLDARLRHAFCGVRPPGHHATRDAAMGFCVFSNVALAAKHAVVNRGLSRVAIVDFDVHHGNGTEDIVAGDERIEMMSFYQSPFYPNTDASGAKNMHNTPVPAHTSAADVRAIVSNSWLPRLAAFRPELILISAGFDAHRDDEIAQLGLLESDYAWITAQLCAVADTHAHGRIVSCLEGGYHLQALAKSVASHLRVLVDLG